MSSFDLWDKLPYNEEFPHAYVPNALYYDVFIS